jgi:hypothetical protein
VFGGEGIQERNIIEWKRNAGEEKEIKGRRERGN